MSLKDKIKKHSFVIEKCPLGRLIERLTPDDQNTLLEAIKKGTPTMTLVAALREEGYAIGEPSFNLHRQGKCRCTTE
jgi:hypothetical protein